MKLVVIDTNVLISANILPQGSTRAVLTHLRRGSFTPLYHPRTLAELVNVLGRKRIANKYLVANQRSTELHHQTSPRRKSNNEED